MLAAPLGKRHVGNLFLLSDGVEKPRARGEMGGSESAAVRRVDDSYWEWFLSSVGVSDEITGKYLIFSLDRKRLVEIALAEVGERDFPCAKIPLPGENLHPEYVLCLYYQDDSRKHELAGRYKGEAGLKYRYWKSNAATGRREYSKEFLGALTPEDRARFEG